MTLTITLSAALLMGTAVFLLCRYAGLRILHAAVCIIFGFCQAFQPDVVTGDP